MGAGAVAGELMVGARPWLIVGALLVMVFLGRALYFDLRARFLRKVEARWREYILQAEAPKLDDLKWRWLEERTRKVIRLVEDAGTSPGERTIASFAGYGHVVPSRFNLMDNWLYRNEEVSTIVYSALIQAHGHYRDERNRSLNPLSWIESLVFLPRKYPADYRPEQAWFGNSAPGPHPVFKPARCTKPECGWEGPKS